MEWILSVASLLTATLSGVFGMAGGLLLFGVYSALLPVASAVVLHSSTQLLSNLGRVVVQWRWVRLRLVGWFVLGALPVYALWTGWGPRVEPSTLFLLLGGSVVASFLVPRRPVMDATRPVGSVLAGTLTTAAQLTGGVGGPLMDLFWVDVDLDRRAVVATKALTQAVAHVLRVAAWAPLVVGIDVSGPGLGGVAVATILGTLLGSAILEHLGDHNFRLITRYIVGVLGLGYLFRGLLLATDY